MTRNIVYVTIDSILLVKVIHFSPVHIRGHILQGRGSSPH